MVYDFIVDELLNQQTIPSKTHLEIQQQDQAVQKDTSLKPYPAEVQESQFSHILTQLCRGFKSCQNLAFYQKDGLLIGITDSLNQHSSFLSDPLNSLGIKKLSCKNSICEYEITWAIL